MVTDLGLSTSGVTNSYATITGGDGGSAAAILEDSITFNGEGINITATNAGAGFDTIAFDLDISDLVAGVTVALSDEIAVDQAADPNVRFSFTDVVEDLDIPNAITTNGLVTRTAANTYTSRSIVASADEDELGITVTNGDGVSGNPTVGLDIFGLIDPAADMAVTDEFPLHDKSEGTAGANRKITGQNIADGANTLAGPNLWETISSDAGSTVANIRTDTLTIAGGTGISTAIAGDTVTITNTDASVITISTINGQPVPTFSDTTRGPKTLSVETIALVWSDTSLSADEFLEFQEANNADAGFNPPHNATIVKAPVVCEDNNGPGVRDIDLYLNGVLSTSGILSFTGAPTGQEIVSDVTLNINVATTDVIHLRGDSGANALADVAVVLFFKWRTT